MTRDPLVRKALKANKDLLGRKDSKATKEFRGLKVPRENRARQDCQDCQDCGDLKACAFASIVITVSRAS